MAAGEIVPHPNADVVASSEVPSLMDAIRPQWQAKGLIERVRRLLPVDPSSACQRPFNAAVADLREKVKIAGIDIAKEAAASFKLLLSTGPTTLTTTRQPGSSTLLTTWDF